MNIKTPPARRKQREERVVDRATDSFQMDKEISLGVDKEKSLKWNMNNSPKTNKEKSSKTSKEKSLETLWQEVQALDSSPRRPSSLSTQVYISLTNAMQYMKVAPSSGIYPTRSCAALRAADLDWIVGPEYSLGGYITLDEGGGAGQE